MPWTSTGTKPSRLPMQVRSFATRIVGCFRACFAITAHLSSRMAAFVRSCVLAIVCVISCKDKFSSYRLLAAVQFALLVEMPARILISLLALCSVAT